MYKPIKISEPSELLESHSLENNNEEVGSLFTEAVFIDGKNKLQPIVDQFQKIKDALKSEIDEKQRGFQPQEFLRNIEFKYLEDILRDIFGFRNVNIYHWRERYIPKSGDFSSKSMNCITWPTWRFPIDGLVTDKGFYDSTHSINTDISFSLGIINELSAEELTAIFLHEFGHNIDPALVDITYTETNVFSKYLTDRVGAISEMEKATMKKNSKSLADGIVVIGIYTLMALAPFLIKFITFNQNRAIEKLKRIVSQDKDKFDRQNNIEAFADNFARMYGFGPQLMTALNKIGESYDNRRSRLKLERLRQMAIMDMTKSAIYDVHKTDMHRVYSLMNEYKKDLSDPNIPDRVKKDIESDMKSLEAVVDKLTNDKGDFRKRVNKAIYDALNEKHEDASVDVGTTPETEITSESFDVIEERGKHPLKLKMEKECPLDRGDLAKIKERFGYQKCSFAKDKDGYFAYTHRCRSKSYKTIDELPKSKVDFVSSTA